MRPTSFSLLAMAALASCATPAATVTAGDNWAILPGPAAAELLHQCSRSAPEPGEATWQPSPDDIARMEAVLPAALAAEPQAQGADFSDLDRRWQRQYVGLVRGGKRFIYGNFFPAHDRHEAMDWRSLPVRVCDGGRQFFGAEYDLEAGRISHLAFNGRF